MCRGNGVCRKVQSGQLGGSGPFRDRSIGGIMGRRERQREPRLANQAS